MAFEVILSPQAVEDFKGLSAHERGEVRDSIALHLTHEPTRTSKSRIKRLRGLEQPQFRLRVGEIRVFYDIVDTEVHVLTIIPKERAQRWLNEAGTPSKNT